MAHARLDGAKIANWDSLHDVCAQEFGFPDFYGRNGNAWIDCLTYIDEGDGMSRFVLQPGEMLDIEIAGSSRLAQRKPELLLALVEWTAAVNERFVESGGQPRLRLLPV